MLGLRFLPLFVFVCAILSGSALTAQNLTPEVQIVSRIDTSALVTLKGSTHPAAIARNDRGRVSPDLPLTDLVLVLSRSPRQQAAFDSFVASQYDSSSPNFHHWLEPAEVGQQFGPAASDVEFISNWLLGQGISVDEVSKDRMSIRFSGTARQVESAFHTEIHNLEVNGVTHIGNMTDPQIPAAFTPAVVGVKALHNFFPRPLHRVGNQVLRNSETGGWQRIGTDSHTDTMPGDLAVPRSASPEYGITTGFGGQLQQFEDVAPYDFATIYNVLPLWQASTPIDGTGQTIAIAGTSSINLAEVTAFRSMFGLPAYTAANAPSIVSGNGTSPLICTSTSAGAVCGITDLIENTLDVEWAGAVAKGAKIVLVTSASKSTTDDTLLDSENFIVQNKTAPIMNVSYGECELAMGTAYNATYNNLWQTAASEGIAVFVASGDQGSAACDLGTQKALTPAVADYGLMVSGFASTPYNTAVGGTDFNWCKPTAAANCTTAAPYWGATNNATTGATALGYVPEVPWNDTCSSPQSIAFLATVALSFNGSAVTNAETACNFVVNNYKDFYKLGHRDISGFVNVLGGSGGPSNCSTNTTLVTPTITTLGTCTGGYAKPSWQTGVPGIPADGARDIPDVSFFAADGLWNSAYLICASAAGTACTGANTPTEAGGTSFSSPAMAGVMALINQKAGTPQGNPNKELYALAAKQTYSNCSAESVSNSSSSCSFNDIDAGTIAMPCDNGIVVAGLSPNCVVNTGGDTVGILSGYGAAAGYDLATGLGSLNVANVVNNWTPTIGSAPTTITVTPASTSLLVTAALNVNIKVASASGSGATPTGTVTLSGGGYTAVPATLMSGSYTFTIPAGSLALGSDALSVTYSGDQTYASATNNTITVQVNGLTPSITVTPSVTSLNSSATLAVTVTLTGVSGSPTPTGTVTLSSGSYASGAQQPTTPGSYSFTIPANTLSAGSNVLTAAYSGDAIYVPVTNSLASVTVTLTTFALSANSGSLTLVAGATTGNTSTISLMPAGGFVGTVNLSCAVTTSPASTTSPATCSIPSSVVIGGATAATATLAVLTTSSTTPGVYAVTVTGTDAVSGKITATTPVTVTVNPVATFSLSSSGVISVAAGATTGNTSTISVTPASGFTGAVALSCSVTTSPSGATSPATCSIPTSASVTGTAAATSTLTVSTTATTTAGAYAVTVTGASAGITQTTVVNVTVTAAASGGVFTLSATAPTAIANPGGTTTSTVTVGSSNGYAGTVTLSCTLTNSPSGATKLPTCSSGSAAVILSAGTTSGTATVTISSTANASLTFPKVNNSRGWNNAAGGAILAFLGLLAIPARRRSWKSMLGVLALTVAFWSFSGCKGFWDPPGTTTTPGTTTGSYTFTVTGAGNPVVAPAPTTTFTVTVN